MIRILLVEDEKLIARAEQSMLEILGYEVVDTASTGDEAIEKALSLKPDLILMDIRLKGERDGISAAGKILKQLRVPIIFLTAHSDDETVHRAKKIQPYGFLTKPFERGMLRSAVETATYKFEMDTKLRESEDKYRTLFNNIADSVVIFDKENHRFLDCNVTFQRLYGYSKEEFLSMTPFDLHPPEELDKVKKNINLRNVDRPINYHHLTKDGRFIPVEIQTNEIDYLGRPAWISIVRNITKRKLLENQLAQAQKLESIGQLAAGIAHEINTPTQYVGDNTRFLKDAFTDIMKLFVKYQHFLQAIKAGNINQKLIDELEETINETDMAYLLDEVPRAIEQALEGIGRITHIVQAMKEFSHPGGQEKTRTDINKAIQTTITVARNEWKYVADMKTDFSPDLPMVPCLPDEFNQVILNMITNAAHAIGDVVDDESSEKGVIRIATCLNGEWVEISVSDTGPGIPEAVRDKIFNPFFTTKETGRGTGQGLAISYNAIVKKHDGSLTFETEEGRGTTFIIRLPVDEHVS